jgi:hypothetical protein
MKRLLMLGGCTALVLVSVGCRGGRGRGVLATGAVDEPKLNGARVASGQRLMAPVLKCDPKQISLRFLQSIEARGAYRSYVYEALGCEAITSLVLGCDHAICNWLDPERAARLDGNCPQQPLQQTLLAEQQMVVYSGCGQTLAYRIYQGKMLKAQPPPEFGGYKVPPPPPPPPSP